MTTICGQTVENVTMPIGLLCLGLVICQPLCDGMVLRIDKNPSCAVCSSEMSVLDLGEDIEAKLEGQIDLTDIDFELN